VPRGYDGRVHMAITFGGGALALLPACGSCSGATAGVAGGAAEPGLRQPRRVPRPPLPDAPALPGLALIYKRHAGQHHRYFTHEQMPIDGLHDLRAVLFPPVLVLFFFGLFATPVWFALAWLFSATWPGCSSPAASPTS
jgi:hypothetical protein